MTLRSVSIVTVNAHHDRNRQSVRLSVIDVWH